MGKVRVPATVVFALLLVPCLLAQNSNTFYYGAANIFGPGTQPYEEATAVEAVFGQDNQMVLLVPRGDLAAEKALSDDLKRIVTVKSVLSYVDTVGAAVPSGFLSEGTRSLLLSEHFSRMVVTVDAPFEGEDAFATVDAINDVASTHYGDSYYLAGNSASVHDMRAVVTRDMVRVNAIAIIAIFLMLLLTFRSLTLPFILVLVIEAAIWVNLAVPYFMGRPLFYIAYLIISSVQLGATVDYAILLTSRYIEERHRHDRGRALTEAMSQTTLSILTSAAILMLGGLMLGFICTNGVISQIGILVGRGAILSALSVLFILPSLLYLLDGPIRKTTRSLRVMNEHTSSN